MCKWVYPLGVRRESAANVTITALPHPSGLTHPSRSSSTTLPTTTPALLSPPHPFREVASLQLLCTPTSVSVNLFLVAVFSVIVYLASKALADALLKCVKY